MRADVAAKGGWADSAPPLPAFDDIRDRRRCLQYLDKYVVEAREMDYEEVEVESDVLMCLTENLLLSHDAAVAAIARAERAEQDLAARRSLEEAHDPRFEQALAEVDACIERQRRLEV